MVSSCPHALQAGMEKSLLFNGTLHTSSYTLLFPCQSDSDFLLLARSRRQIIRAQVRPSISTQQSQARAKRDDRWANLTYYSTAPLQGRFLRRKEVGGEGFEGLSFFDFLGQICRDVLYYVAQSFKAKNSTVNTSLHRQLLRLNCSCMRKEHDYVGWLYVPYSRYIVA